TALRQQRPFHEPARSAKLKITSRSLRSINAPPSLFLRSDCASTFHKVKHYSEPPPLTRRNAQSPPFALVVMPNAIVARCFDFTNSLGPPILLDDLPEHLYD